MQLYFCLQDSCRTSTSPSDMKKRKLRNLVRFNNLRSSRGGTRTRDPGIMSEVTRWGRTLFRGKALNHQANSSKTMRGFFCLLFCLILRRAYRRSYNRT